MYRKSYDPIDLMEYLSGPTRSAMAAAVMGAAGANQDNRPEMGRPTLRRPGLQAADPRSWGPKRAMDSRMEESQMEEGAMEGAIPVPEVLPPARQDWNSFWEAKYRAYKAQNPSILPGNNIYNKGHEFLNNLKEDPDQYAAFTSDADRMDYLLGAMFGSTENANTNAQLPNSTKKPSPKHHYHPKKSIIQELLEQATPKYRFRF